MEKQVMKKITRYIELSEKFTKTDSDILTAKNRIPKNSNDNFIISGGDNICFGNSGSGTISFTVGDLGSMMLDGKAVYIDEDGNVKAKDPKKPLTRGEQYKAKLILEADEDAVLMDEYDEYIKLRKSLKGYFKGIDDLINE